MSVKALNWVWEDSSARTPAETAVLAALADWADAYGFCYPSYTKIARRARVSTRQAQRIVKHFVATGELERAVGGHRVDAPGHRPSVTGLHPVNVYRFTCFPREAELDPENGRHHVARSRRKGVTPTTRRGDTSDREGVTPATSHIRNKPSVDPSERPSGARAPQKGHHGHAYCGTRFCVPAFLHEQFANQLGPQGLSFDLLAWYLKIDDPDTPIGGDVLAWVRREFAAATRRWAGPSRGVAPGADAPPTPIAYLESCRQHGHEPPCATYGAHLIRLNQERRVSA